tara:strand:- start:499 stop:942 length:444 start_codon:yes stop_codon:yes gene_type:complete
MDNPKSLKVKTYIERIKKAFNIKTDTELAKKLNVTQGAIGNWKKRGSIDLEKIAIKCDDISLDYIRTGVKPYFLLDREELVRRGKEIEEQADYATLQKENAELKAEIDLFKDKEYEYKGKINSLKWVVKQVAKGGLFDDDDEDIKIG